MEQVSGQKPEPFETTTRRYFQNPSLIYHGLNAGSKLQAIAFMFRMLMTRAPDLDEWERNHGHPLLKQPILAQDSEAWRLTAEKQQLNLLF